MLTDLLGDPVSFEEVATAGKHSAKVVKPRLEAQREKFMRLITSEKRVETYLAKATTAPAMPLFSNVLEFLKSPLIPLGGERDLSDRNDVGFVEKRGPRAKKKRGPAVDPVIPYDAWGVPWIIDRHGLRWSAEALQFLQIQVFWESMEELALQNNEHEKWSVLKWIFMPCIKRKYVYDQAKGKSHVWEIHERDEPFTFYNCCLAAKMEADVLREMIQRRLPVEVYEAVERVVTF